MAANLASLSLAARTLPEAQFGIFVLVTGLVSVLVQIADFGTGPIFGQHAGTLASNAQPGTPAHGEVRLGGVFWGSFLAVRLGLGLVATACGLALSWSFAAPAAGAMMLVSLSAVFVAARFLDPLFQVAHRPWRSTATQFAGAFATLATTAAAVLLHPTLDGFLFAFVAAAIISVAAYALAVRDLVIPPIEIQPATIRRILRLAAPIGIAGLMTAINGRANLLFLQHQGPDAVAMFGAASRVLDLAVNLAVLVLAPLIPVLSRSARAGAAALALDVRASVRLLLHLTLPILVAAPGLSPLVVHALYGARYVTAAPVLDVLALVGFGVVFSLLASYALLSLRITHYALWITGSAVAANLLLNAVLVPRAGAMGAALAQACSELVLVSLATAALLRHVPGAIDLAGTLRALGLAATAALLLRLLPAAAQPLASACILLACAAPLLRLWRERRAA